MNNHDNRVGSINPNPSDDTNNQTAQGYDPTNTNQPTNGSNQNNQQPDDGQQQDQVSGPVQPLIPKGGEINPYTSVETLKPGAQTQVENVTNIETLTNESMPAPSLKEQVVASTQPTAPPTQTQPQNQPQIVDQTNTPTQLHTLKNNVDPLTKEADEEEEKFIEEVEKHHGVI